MKDSEKIKELLHLPGLDVRTRLCLELAAAFRRIDELEDRLSEAQTQVDMLSDAYRSVAGVNFSPRAVRPVSLEEMRRNEDAMEAELRRREQECFHE